MPIIPNESRIILQREDVKVTAIAEPGEIVRTTDYGDGHPIVDHFPGCSIRQRGGVWYIGGPGAPKRDWEPEVRTPAPEEG